MRYSQLLFEFDLSKTTQRFGRKLLDRVLNDPTYYPDNHLGNGGKSAISSARYKLMRKWRKADRPANYEELVLNLAAEAVTRHICQISAMMKYGGRGGAAGYEHGFLPSKYFPDGYIMWWLQRYIDGGIPHWEDFHRVRRALIKLVTLRDSGYFKRTPEAAQYADIGRFKGLHELEAFLDTVKKEEEVSNAEKDKPGPNEYRMIADGERWRVVAPLTQNAASYFGRNTKWCTTSENGGAFSSYIGKGPLYIIIDKPNNRRWQWHFPTRQYMDERDSSVELGKFPKDLWEILPPELFITAMQADQSILLIYAPKTVLAKFTPDDVGDMTFEGQEIFAAHCPTEDDGGDHYRRCLPKVRNSALCVAYAAGWHWDKGPIMLEELRKRDFKPGETLLEDPKGHWSVKSFPTFVDALLYDVRENDHHKMWYVLDSIFRGQSRGFNSLMKEFINPTILEADGKRYLFMLNQSRELWAAWDGRDRYWAQWSNVSYKMEEGQFPNFADYDGPEDEPEMWKTIYRNLRKR